jgi:rod shape-determining protein MreC
MYKLIEFIRRVYVVLLFVIIETVALYCYAHSSYYTQAKILASANSVMGGIQGTLFGIRHYFTLHNENAILAQRIVELETELEFYRESDAVKREDSEALSEIDSMYLSEILQYRYMTARVISNTVNHNNNLITLNRGRSHGVVPNMGVITPDGNMVGHVAACSERYSVVIPLINMSFRTGGQVLRDGERYIGSVSWSGGNPYRVNMTELSKYAEVEVDEAVFASSLFFPQNMKVCIGYVEKVTPSQNQISDDVVIRLAADFSRIDNVILIENSDFYEATELEGSVRSGKYLQDDTMSEN